MLLELMDFPKIMEDEDIVGWLRGAAEASGWDDRSFLAAFFPENITWDRGKISVLRGYGGVYNKYKKVGMPDPGSMLMKHTSVPVSGLFMPAFYTGMLAEMVLNGTGMMPFERTRLYKTFMYCPLCVKEDMEKAGRAAFHVPHQVPGITACYKHSVKLSTDIHAEPEQADEHEVRKARVMQILYRKHAVGSVEDILGPLRERAEQRGISLRGKLNAFPVNAGALMWTTRLFTDDEIRKAFKKDDSWLIGCRDIIAKDSPGAGDFSRRFPFVSYTCGKCGTRVTQYAVTVRAGGMCPVCASHTKWQERTTRLARHSIDPEFRVARFHYRDTKVEIRHIPCGKIITDRQINYVFRKEKMDCPFCRDAQHETHVGEKRRMNCGLMAVITRFNTVVDIDIRFEDGSERKGISYSNFLLGTVIPERYYQDSHLGEKKVMNCGMEGTITRYASKKDIDVCFADGSMASGVTYEAFKQGKLIPESLRPTERHRKERLGETRRMNCGLMATIIDYVSSTNITVRFETGQEKAHVKYHQFLHGELSPEGFYLPKVGEERTMKNGLKAKIIAVRRYTDIDVQFENGEVRNGVGYQAFRDGYVKSEEYEKSRRADRIGEKYPQHCGLVAEIIEYKKATDVTVRFDNGEIREGVAYGKLKKGSVLPPSMQKKN